VHAKLTRLVAACRNDTTPAAPSNDKWLSDELFIPLTFNCNKKCVKVKVYYVSFHGAN
jgi:hypothetical protein